MRNLVPIGRFSKICRLTVKALRLYDELSLLRPAMVDTQSGYRFYSLAQATEGVANVESVIERIGGLGQHDPGEPRHGA